MRNIIIGTLSIGGVMLYKGLNMIIRDIRDKREREIYEIQKEWHEKSFNGGYESGLFDGKIDSIKDCK